MGSEWQIKEGWCIVLSWGSLLDYRQYSLHADLIEAIYHVLLRFKAGTNDVVV